MSSSNPVIFYSIYFVELSSHSTEFPLFGECIPALSFARILIHDGCCWSGGSRKLSSFLYRIGRGCSGSLLLEG